MHGDPFFHVSRQTNCKETIRYPYRPNLFEAQIPEESGLVADANDVSDVHCWRRRRLGGGAEGAGASRFHEYSTRTRVQQKLVTASRSP